MRIFKKILLALAILIVAPPVRVPEVYVSICYFGHGANEHEGATLPTYEPSGHCLTSMAHLTFSLSRGFLNNIGEGIGEMLLINEGIRDNL